MFNNIDNFDINVVDIDPEFITNIVNDCCYVYTKITSSIIAFDIYKILKDKNCGKKFIFEVLEQSNDSFKNLVEKFISDEKLKNDDTYNYINYVTGGNDKKFIREKIIKLSN